MRRFFAAGRRGAGSVDTRHAGAAVRRHEPTDRIRCRRSYPPAACGARLQGSCTDTGTQLSTHRRPHRSPADRAAYRLSLYAAPAGCCILADHRRRELSVCTLVGRLCERGGRPPVRRGDPARACLAVGAAHRRRLSRAGLGHRGHAAADGDLLSFIYAAGGSGLSAAYRL